ncbi:MAG TPA: molybdenum cofactor guanylyltransferase [Candidatus Acidoferrum sp.]|nr:molybdenum cofactor guanylyltransferase [Candidatus Acidoferrum sp.]
MTSVAGYVLAGGASARFGSDKALAEIGGQATLVWVANAVAEAADGHPTVVGPAGKYARFGWNCIADRWPGEGPLGGIVTALLHAREKETTCDWNLIVSCDMPFLTAPWLSFLVGRAENGGAEVVLANSSGGPEPLCACWKTEACEALHRAFARGVRKVTDGIALLRTEVLDEREWKRFDSAGRLFWNMNTPADYEEACRIVAAERE